LNWNPSSPNNWKNPKYGGKVDQDYVIMYSTGEWNDMDYTEKAHPVCQKKVSTTTTTTTTKTTTKTTTTTSCDRCIGCPNGDQIVQPFGISLLCQDSKAYVRVNKENNYSKIDASNKGYIRAGSTYFTAFRLTFDNSKIFLVTNDFTFGVSKSMELEKGQTRKNEIKVGYGGDCFSPTNQKENRKGLFSIDLTGTKLSFDPSVKWTTSGWKPGMFDYVKTDQKASAKCGGYCGFCIAISDSNTNPGEHGTNTIPLKINTTKTTTTTTSTTLSDRLDCPDTLRISSEEKTNVNGIYKKTDQIRRDQPVWHSKENDIYLFVSSALRWNIAATKDYELDNTMAFAYAPFDEKCPQGLDYKVWLNDEWKTDLAVSESERLDCPDTFIISSKQKTTVNGIYKKTDQIRRDQSVWHSKESDRYLFVSSNLKWYITTTKDYELDNTITFAFAPFDEKCPQGLDYKVWLNDEWKTGTDFAVSESAGSADGWEHKKNTYLKGWTSVGELGFDTLGEAQSKCLRVADCGGVVLQKNPIQTYNGKPYQLRKGSEFKISSDGEEAWKRGSGLELQSER